MQTLTALQEVVVQYRKDGCYYVKWHSTCRYILWPSYCTDKKYRYANETQNLVIFFSCVNQFTKTEK